MALRLIEKLYAHARCRPEAIALREAQDCGDGRTLTYGRLVSAVEYFSEVLSTNLPDHAIVMIAFHNRIEFFVAYYATLMAGRTAFPVHPSSSVEELTTAAMRSRAHAVVGETAVCDALCKIGRRVVDLDLPRLDSSRVDNRRSDMSDSACMLLQSSGTTGPPKIVERRGPSLDAVAANVADAVKLTPQDVVLGVVPACHSYGVENVVLGPMWAGCQATLCRDFDTRQVADELVGGETTVLPGVPTMFEMLAQTAAGAGRSSALRSAYSAGAILPPAVGEAFTSCFGVRVGQLFGMTEIGSVTFNDPADEGFDPQSVGLPMAGVCIRVVAPDTRDVTAPLPPGREGEVAIAAPSMLAGYLRDDDGTCETPDDVREGYFLTGDLGRLDDRGRLTITGRLKLIVDVGGQKVNLQEVERALTAHPAVGACLVVPVPVSETIVRLKAVVERRSGNTTVSADELRVFLRPKLSAHKIPRMIEFCDSLPKSPTGKVLRQVL